MDFASDNASAASMNEIIRFILESESDSAVTLTEATSGGSSFIIHMSGTGTSTFGHLESEKGSKLVDAVQHDGKMYMNVTQATYVEAMLAEAKGSPVSQSEFIQATSLAMPLLLQGNQAVNKLVTDPPVIARWQTFRQACCAIEAAVEITTRAKHVPDYMKRWLQIACNSAIEAKVARYLNSKIKNNLEEYRFMRQYGDKYARPEHIPLEVARAACGWLDQHNPCRLSSTMADLLEERVQLDVGNLKLFVITKASVDEVD